MGITKANLINNGINFYDGDKLNHFRITSSKWIFHICSLLCNNGAFGSVLQRCANSSFQEKIKPEYLGRVFSLTGSIMSLAMPIGLILSGFFADRIDVNHWFLLSGILIICIAIVCPMITEIRKLDAK